MRDANERPGRKKRLSDAIRESRQTATRQSPATNQARPRAAADGRMPLAVGKLRAVRAGNSKPSASETGERSGRTGRSRPVRAELLARHGCSKDWLESPGARDVRVGAGDCTGGYGQASARTERRIKLAIELPLPGNMALPIKSHPPQRTGPIGAP